MLASWELGINEFIQKNQTNVNISHIIFNLRAWFL